MRSELQKAIDESAEQSSPAKCVGCKGDTCKACGGTSVTPTPSKNTDRVPFKK